MKALFSLLALSLTIGFASVSKAVVVDRLQCKMKISDSAFGESSDQEQELNIPRLPGKTGFDYETSDANAKMEVKFHNDRGEIYRAQLLIHYRHAFKKDAQGKTLEARQTHCIGLTGEYRDPRGNTGSSFPCSNNSDPFSPLSGWKNVAIAEGIPAFNEDALELYSIAILDYKGGVAGTAAASCKFLSTLN